MLKPSFLAGLVLTVALAIPCLAFPQTIRGGGGGAAAALTVDFGGTLTGYGGFDTGLSGTVTISSLTGGSCANSKDLIVDGNGMIVPNNVAHTYGGASSNTWPDNSNYGTISVTYAYSSACTMVVTNGTTTKTYSVTFTPNARHVRAMDGTTYNADTGLYRGWQLGVLVNVSQGDGRELKLGDTVYVRPGTTNSAASGGPFVLYPPSGLYSGTGRITITSDAATSTSDGQGNYIPGGNANLGPIYVSGQFAGDVALPLDFRSLTFNPNSASASAQPVITYASNAHGLGFYSNYIAWGPLIPAALAASQPLISDSYGGADASATEDGEGNYFANGQSVKFAAPNTVGALVCPHVILKNNIWSGMLEKALQLSAPGGDIVTDNLFVGTFANGASHADDIIFGSLVYCTNSTTGPTVARNVILHGDSTPSAINTTTFVSATGTASNASYPQLAATTLTGSGRYAYLDVTVAGGVYSAVYSAPTGSFAGGLTQPGGRGFHVGDQVSVVVGGFTVTFAVASLNQSPDALPIFMDTNRSVPINPMVVQNNIIEAVDGDSIYVWSVSGGLVNNNDALVDFQSFPTAGFPGSITALNGSGGSFDWNVSNSFDISGQTGSPTCLPGTPSTTTCGLRITATTLAAYQALWPSYDTTTAYATGYTRANAILNHKPSAAGSCVLTGGNAGKVTCALNPADNAGVVSWAVPGAVFDPAATHTPAS